MIKLLKRRIFDTKKKSFDDRTQCIEDLWIKSNVESIEDLILFAKFKGSSESDAIQFMEEYKDEHRVQMLIAEGIY